MSLRVVHLQADSLWYAPDGTPSIADKLLIQRLEVEAQLVTRQGRGSSASCGGAAELPPLDLSAAAAGEGAQFSQVPPAFLCPISMQVRARLLQWMGSGSAVARVENAWTGRRGRSPLVVCTERLEKAAESTA